MKKRFRALVRGGWHLHEIPPNDKTVIDTTNEYHYYMLREWCAKNVGKDEWEGTLVRTATSRPAGQKRFVFKNAEDKLMFALRWGTSA